MNINRSLLSAWRPQALRRCCLSMLSTPLTTGEWTRGASTLPDRKSGATNFYKRLQVSSDASAADIKAAYRRHALECHPDVVEDAQRAAAEVRFRAMSEAYEALSDPARRREHDDRLGIRAPSSASSSSAAMASQRRSATSASPTRRAQRSRTYTSYAASTTAQAQQQQQQGRSTKWKRQFVRGDADRAFSDAFDGRSIDQILFDARRRQRQQHAEQRHQGAGSAQAAAGREESMRRVVENWAQASADRLTLQHGGPSILRKMMPDSATTSRLPSGPQAAPGTHMPFRPFVNMAVPEGVTTPPEPQMGAVEDSNADGVQVKVPTDTIAKRRAAGRRNLANALAGDDKTRIHALNRSDKFISGASHNMGQLYSYHRPY